MLWRLFSFVKKNAYCKRCKRVKNFSNSSLLGPSENTYFLNTFADTSVKEIHFEIKIKFFSDEDLKVFKILHFIILSIRSLIKSVIMKLNTCNFLNKYR